MNFGPDATRAEHLEWCKARALEYVDAGNNEEAFTSMASDMRKHPETKDHAAIGLGLQLLLGGHLEGPVKMREFINGFN